jgi:hypothetical protein
LPVDFVLSKRALAFIFPLRHANLELSGRSINGAMN